MLDLPQICWLIVCLNVWSHQRDQCENWEIYLRWVVLSLLIPPPAWIRLMSHNAIKTLMSKAARQHSADARPFFLLLLFAGINGNLEKSIGFIATNASLWPASEVRLGSCYVFIHDVSPTSITFTAWGQSTSCFDRCPWFAWLLLWFSCSSSLEALLVWRGCTKTKVKQKDTYVCGSHFNMSRVTEVQSHVHA